MLGFIWRKLSEKPEVIEESVPFRIIVLASVLCGILATLSQEEWPKISIFVIAGTIFGYWVSWKRKGMNNAWLKLLLTAGAVWAGFDTVNNTFRTPYDPRIPIANLLLWFQCLHSYDLPSRKDLNYSIMVSFVLIVIGATLSHNVYYLFFLITYTILVFMALYYSAISRLGSLSFNKIKGRLTPGRIFKMSITTIALTAALSGVIFFLMPRFTGFKIRPLPMSWIIHLDLTLGKLMNPAYPDNPEDSTGLINARFDKDNYFGFNTYLNLNARGRLSKEVVLRVRTTKPSYYRGMSFDYYDGYGWKNTRETASPLSSGMPPITVDYPPGVEKPMVPQDFPSDSEIVQVFYVEREQPNIIFCAFKPHLLYFPSNLIYVDNDLGLRSPFKLEKGVIYSCISVERSFEPSRLRPTDYRAFRYFYPQYFQVPELSDRVRTLTTGITRGLPTAYDRTVAIMNYLRENYPYDLDIPPFPPKKEVVDYFLFEQKRGYCEHFATAMTVMCRSVGIPARLATGFTPGEYNPFTSYYEIRSEHAHAWVEVFMPDVGWMSFDPTPGWTQFPGTGVRKETWPAAILFNWLKSNIFIPAAQKIKNAISMLPPMPDFMKKEVPAITAIIIVMAGLIILIIYLKKKRIPLPFFKGAGPRDIKTGRVFEIYRKTEKALARRGLKRAPCRTPKEFRDSLSDRPFIEPLDEITCIFTEARYSGRAPGSEKITAIESAWAKFKKLLKLKPAAPAEKDPD